MPGIVGFAGELNYIKDPEKVLFNMREIITHYSFYHKDELFLDEKVACSRAHIGVLQNYNQPFNFNNKIFVWLEGEFYNQSQLKLNYKVESNSDIEIFVKLYSITGSFDFLSDIDGFFVALIYDKNKNKIFLANDRYGLKPLYYLFKNNILVWSSEVKAFLEFPLFKPKIDNQALNEFFTIGYILENRTWFEDVKLTTESTVLEFDLKTYILNESHFWRWDKIKPLREKIEEKEIVDKLGKLFLKSVNKRVRGKENIGLLLSGGLDSRAIFASIPEDVNPLNAFTFGKKGCDDIKIAKKVVKLKNANHHIVTLNHENWFEHRIEGIWVTDGQFNLIGMDAFKTIKTMKKLVDINLNGFLGDAVLGGSYIDDNNMSVVEKIHNRGRRFINGGTIFIEVLLANRNPFFDNDLMEFILSIPESLRKNSYIYNKMLLKFFPDYYEAIPWHKTGISINWHPSIVKLIKSIKQLKRGLLHRICERVGIQYLSSYYYCDYSNWIRNEPARNIFRSFLLDKDALYTQYLPVDKVRKQIELHLNYEKNYAMELCRYLTFEIWLKQVYERQLRNCFYE